jgi:predicted enzyme related to lactoylglutathione lyase
MGDERKVMPTKRTAKTPKSSKNPIQGLRTAIYYVPSLERAKKWYSQILGIKPYFDESFYVGFNVGGYELGLHPGTAGSGIQDHGVGVYWGVANAKSAYKRLIKLGGRRHSDVQDVGGGIKVASVVDPFGNTFGIIENPHFSPK